MYAGRKVKLELMGFSNYLDYLQSDLWEEIRERYRKSKMPQRCTICNDKEVDLHHRSYKRIGKERLHDLVPLCRRHHSELHKILSNIKRDQWWLETRKFINYNRKSNLKKKNPEQ